MKRSSHQKTGSVISFFRYEVPYHWNDPEEIFYDAKITFEDIRAALEHISVNRITAARMYEEWLAPLLAIRSACGLTDLFPEGEDLGPEDEPRFHGPTLPLDRRGTVYTVIGALRTEGQEADEKELAYVQPWIEAMDNVLANEHLPMRKWKLNPVQKMLYIQDLYDHDIIDLVDDAHKELFKRCLADECHAGSREAMRIKAYCLYGGNTLYQCSYEKAAEILSALVQAEGDPFDANALGVLCYEGLAHGTPDYELAYQYFTIGAFNGVFESMCYCADMLIKGEGVPVNLRAAASLVHLAYSRTKEKFTDGAYDASFAESALRMGDCARYGIGERSDGMLAMSYYLEAELAIRIRMRVSRHFQDERLYRRIESRIEEAETALGEEVMKNESLQKEPIIIDRLLSCGHPIVLHVDHEKDSDMFTLIFRRCHPENGESLLLTIESMELSELYDSVAVIALRVSSGSLEDRDELVIDRVGLDHQTGETVFFYEGEEAGRIKAEAWLFRDQNCLQSRKEEDTLFTSVCFDDLHNTYDYICNIPGLKRGDRVLVDTSQGAAAATVVREFREKMSRMPLPEKRYRRMIQKITPQLYS